MLTAGDEIAFLDVREQGQYGEGHPFFCVPFAYSRLEHLANKLLPCKHTQLVLLDDGDDVALRAARSLETLGHNNVAVLEGGAPGWERAGFTLYKGVNVISKTYGELLEHAADTPRITATELRALKASNPDVLVLDGRSPAEYRQMSLPGALCCPNAELGYRIRELAPDPATTIVINCAGRTRSILGAEGLRILGTPNPVYALENGTQGWKLAGFDLNHGVEPEPLPQPDAKRAEALSAQAQALIANAELPLIAPDTLLQWQADTERTIYLLDVRTQAEFDEARWPGARHAPGGQLIQATDQYVAVRYARIVLSDDNRLRAATTAVRLRDMGHDVYLLDADASKGTGSRASVAGHLPGSVVPEQFPTMGELDGATILDASRGMDYRDGHIDKAQWVTRARLDRLNLQDGESVFITGRDATLIDGVRRELSAMGVDRIRHCPGDPETWVRAGHKVVATANDPAEADCIDYLFFVHDRHAGNMDAARRYLEWEVGLVAQLDEQERESLTPRARFDKGS